MEPCPHDAISLARGPGSPVAGAGEGVDDVQPVGAVAGGTGLPGATEVFDFDPDVAGARLAADGEELARAGGVEDGVGSELAGDQDGVRDSGSRPSAPRFAGAPGRSGRPGRRTCADTAWPLRPLPCSLGLPEAGRSPVPVTDSRTGERIHHRD